MSADSPRRILVGVDDTPESHAAVAWAAGEAWARDAELWMVHAYTRPVPIAWHTVPLPPRPGCCDAAAEQMLSRLELELLGPDPQLRVRRIAVEGVAADVLCRLSINADLLVVGGRRHPALREVVMGSVARAVTRSAHCPVTVVHPDDVVAMSPTLRVGA